MIENWEIKQIGNKKALLIKGDFKDILAIVKKVGPILSRPERFLSGDYNFIMYILKDSDSVEEKIKTTLNEISKMDAKKTKSHILKKEIDKKEEKTKIEEDISIPMPELEIKIKEDITTKEDSKRVVLPSKGPVIPKSQSVRIKKEDLNKDAKHEEKKAKSEEQVLQSPKLTQRTLDRLKLRWSIELPLNPMMSFQTLITGSHNRFAHAASMAVVENPGVMYNPILIWGPMGSGKSHFIHSMSYGLSSTIGQKNMFVTNGIKLSVGVNIALKSGFLDVISNLIENSKVIIIDDVHLMLINNENRDFISKVINTCMRTNKQVVFSSLFSPKDLEPLETMLGVDISQGWMVDIKYPNPQVYRMILDQILFNMDVKLAEDYIKKFFISRSLDFRTVTMLLSRMKKFEKYILASNPNLMHHDLIEMLLGDNDDNTNPLEDEIKSSPTFSSLSSDSFYKWGMFYPSGMSDYVNYICNEMKRIAKDVINIDLDWHIVFMEEYDANEVYGVPFKIGNYVLDKNVNGVIILGPPPSTNLSTKEAEFKHLVEKILESLNVKCGWIYSSRLKARSVYLNAILSLI